MREDPKANNSGETLLVFFVTIYNKTNEPDGSQVEPTIDAALRRNESSATGWDTGNSKIINTDPVYCYSHPEISHISSFPDQTKILKRVSQTVSLKIF